MIISRIINDQEIEVNINESNEIYLPEKIYNKLENIEIGSILNTIYSANYNEEFKPLSLFLELTDNCNFNCPFCYIHKKVNISSPYIKFDELKQSLDYLIYQGLIYCTISGGEALLHPEFKEIYKYLKESGVLVTVFTNGSLINKEILKLFKKYKPFKIEISLYGIDEKTYYETTQNKFSSVNYENIYNNILLLRNMGIQVIAKTPITILSYEYYKEIEKWCKENKISFDSTYELMDTYDGEKRSKYEVLDIEKEKLLKKSKQDYFNNEELIKLSVSKQKQKLSFDCSAGKTDLFITSKYHLVPCMKAVNIDEWNFNIKEVGIENALIYMNGKIKSCKDIPLEYCKGCIHHQVCQECFMTKYEYVKDLKEHRLEYCSKLKKYFDK